MRRVGHFRALATVGAVTAVLLVHCATPTAILVDVYSDLDCTNGAQVVLVGAESLDALSTSAPTSYATRCEPQSDGTFYRGRVVLVPSSTDETVAFAIATRTNGADPASCLASGADCIVSKRSIGFIEHNELTSQIHLRASCLGVVCTPSETCEQGQCIPASVSCDSGGSCGFPTPVAPELSAGAAHTCALRIDGTVVCWGDNSRGQLGDGTTTSRATPAPVVGVSAASHLSGGGSGNHACARVYDEDVVCWGANEHGQIGDGTTTDRPTPVNLGLCSCDDPVLLVATGAAHTCIVRDNGGAVQCWGDDTFNQLGVGTQIGALDAGSTIMNATSVSAGDRSTCALEQDNTVVCWGDNGDGELGQGNTNPNPGIATAQVAGATSVSVGALGACVTTAGDPFCWGSNATDLLLTASPTPGVPVDMTALAGAQSVSSAGGHACAVLGDGSVVCWGLNDHGQCGDGTTTDRTSPGTVAGLQGVTAIAAGLSHTCAWAKDGIYCWGDDTLGQLGDGKTGTISTTPVKVTVP